MISGPMPSPCATVMGTRFDDILCRPQGSCSRVSPPPKIPRYRTRECGSPPRGNSYPSPVCRDHLYLRRNKKKPAQLKNARLRYVPVRPCMFEYTVGYLPGPAVPSGFTTLTFLGDNEQQLECPRA